MVFDGTATGVLSDVSPARCVLFCDSSVHFRCSQLMVLYITIPACDWSGWFV